MAAQFPAIKRGMGDIAAPAAGDLDLREELPALLDQGDFGSSASLRAGNGGEAAGSPPACDHDMPSAHSANARTV